MYIRWVRMSVFGCLFLVMTALFLNTGCDCGGQILIGEGETGKVEAGIEQVVQELPTSGGEEIQSTEPVGNDEPGDSVDEASSESTSQDSSTDGHSVEQEPVMEGESEPGESGFVGPNFHFRVFSSIEDTVPPKLLGVSFQPAQVKDGDWVEVSITVGPDLSEVTNAQVLLASPSSIHSVYVDTSYHPSKKAFVAMIQIPKRVEGGSWVVQRATLLDGAGRPAVYLGNQSPLQGITLQVSSTNADTTGPVLKSIALEKTQVNAGESIAISLNAEDTGVGLGFVEIEAQPVNGGSRVSTQVMYHPVKKVFMGYFRFPPDEQTGRWKVTRVDLSDVLQNRTSVSSSDPALQGLEFDVKSTATPPSPDTKKPEVLGAWLEPLDVDAGQPIRVIVHAQDPSPGSGIRWARVTVANPIGEIRFQFDLRRNAATGYWEGNGNVPAYSRAGIWRLESIEVIDAAGNTQRVAGDDLYKNLPLLTESQRNTKLAHLAVQVQAIQPAIDRKPPLLKGINIAPGQIKVGEAIRVYAQLEDPGGSGINGASCTWTGPRGRLDQKQVLLAYNSDTGFFEGTLPFREGDTLGNWWISGCFLQDKSGNTSPIAGWALAKLPALDISRATTLASKDPFVVKVESNGASPPTDTTPPQMQSFHIAPGQVTRPGKLRFFAKVDDSNGSGVDGGNCEFQSVAGLGLGYENVKSVSAYMSYNPATGLWEAEISIPDEALRGEWWIQSCQWRDKAGNTVSLDAPMLANLPAVSLPHIQISVASDHRIFSVSDASSTPDQKAPEVLAIHMSPKTVMAGEFVRVYLKAKDNVGIVSAFCSIKPSLAEPPFSSYGAAHLEFNPENQLWEGNFRLSTNAWDGSWSLAGCQVLDQAGNRWNGGPDDIRNLPVQDLSAILGNKPTKSTSFTMTNPNTLDRDPPDASKIKWLPNTQANAGSSALLQVVASDKGLGLLRIEAVVQSPTGLQQQFIALPYNLATQAWEGVVSFPSDAETGKWKVSKLDLYDWGGNIKNYTTTDTLLNSSEIQVVGGVPSSDKLPPTVAKVSMSRSAVLAGESVRIQAELSDDVSGVTGGNFDLISPKKGIRSSANLEWNPATKKWEGEAIIPLQGEDGVWKAHQLVVRDAAGRYTSLDTQHALLSSLTITVRNSVSQQDTEAPTIQNFSIAPSSITAGESVHISAEVKDNLSGVAGVSVQLESANKERLYFLELRWNPVTQRFGVNHPILIDAPGGLYEITSITLRDRAGNFKTITKGDPFLP